MQITRRQPRMEYWSPLTRLRDELDRFFGHDFEPGSFYEGWFPALDVREENNQLIIKAELPGMKKEDINVSLHENTLTLSGEKKCEEEEKGGETYRSERCYGKFQRSITLPWAVEPGKVDATYRDGVLTIKLPKSEQAKPKQIDVKVA